MKYYFKKSIIFILIIFTSYSNFAQIGKIKHLEPAFWWTGMKNTNLQLLVHGDNIGKCNVHIQSDKIDSYIVQKIENKNYLFIDLKINKKAKPGTFSITFTNNEDGDFTYVYIYKLKERRKQKRGFGSEDLVYLLMPDRFANGNSDNDSHKDMLEKANRKDGNGRHGGDITGIIDNIDYFKKLGVTALWINPMLENNMDAYSYHGYAITDFYKTDPRYGTNEDYLELTKKLRNNDIKIIMDMVFNHCGSNHWWMDDLPFDNWVHQFPEFTRTNYRGSALMDPYTSDSDKYLMSNGWFDKTMPDLNQQNPFLATYLIQNSIWWIEYAGLDGIRMDTHPYPDINMMAEWAKQVRCEYPDITLLGEVWLNEVAYESYFHENTKTSGDYNSHLNSVTDFPLCYAVSKALNESSGWDTGLARLYTILSQDFLYPNAYNNVIFLDNHDLNRYATNLGGDYDKIKMGIAFLLTTRGVPVMYYGTEIAMQGEEHKGHGYIRQDFPGGWKGDKINAFSGKSLNKEQKDLQDYVSKIANWRKTSDAISNGKLKHFIPNGGIYVYFRYTDKESVMIIMNNNNKDINVNTNRFEECLNGYNSGTDIINNKKLTSLNEINIKAKSVKIIELKK